MSDKNDNDKNLIKLILRKQKINYIEKLINKEFIDILLDDSEINHKNENKEYLLSDVLEYLGTGNTVISNSNKGDYPVISTIVKNNGVVATTDTYKFDEPVLYTISRFNFICFIHHGKINTVKDVYVFKPKMNIDNEMFQKALNKKLLEMKNNEESALTINKLNNLKIDLCNDISTNCLKDDYTKQSLDNISNKLKEIFNEYYQSHSIENIDLIKFEDIFQIGEPKRVCNSIKNPLFSFHNKQFHIEIPEQSIYKDYIYFKSKIDYINYEKTIYLMNEFIKYKDNISKDNIKNLIVPIYFEVI